MRRINGAYVRGVRVLYRVQAIRLCTFFIIICFLLGVTSASGMILEEESKRDAIAETPKNMASILRQRTAGREKGVPQAAQYVQGEVIVKFKEGAAPQSVLQEVNLEAGTTERIHSIKPALDKFKKDCTLEKDSEGWYWFKGKNYKEVEGIPDEEIFQEAYVRMTPEERSLYRSYKTTLPEEISVEEAVLRLEEHPAVEYAEPNYIMEILAFPETLPNDTYVDPDQDGTWSTYAWGQPYEDMWGLEKIEADKAWPLSQGEGVVVAVIDSGVDYTHPDLSANMWHDESGNYGYDFSNDDNDPMDDAGHGTHCAGTIAAVGNNFEGIIGVAPEARIMAVKGLNAQGAGYDSGLAKGIKYAADNGADVLSNSWGGVGYSKLLEDAFKYARSKGCVSIAAAGNDNTDAENFMPANIETVIAVAATTHNDEKCSFSNYGLTIDVAAPGGGYTDELGGGWYDIYNILSTKPDDLITPIRRVSYGYSRLAGTSMACPHVAGVAAVIKGLYPEGSPEMIRSRILAGAENIDNSNPSFAGLLGTGRINAYDSLTVEPRIVLKIVDLESENIFPGKNGSLIIHIKSYWQDALNVTAALSTGHPQVTIQNSSVAFGEILSGETKANSADPFIISLDQNIPYGEIINFNLALTAEDGYQEVFNFTLSIAFFENVGKQTNLPLEDFNPISMVMRDYNNDGYTDIFFIGWSDEDLYRNQQDGTFLNVTSETGINTSGVAFTSTFIDIDNDGDQDLFIGSSAPQLFLNNGDETFTDITNASNISDIGDVVQIMTSFDYNNDGFLDIFVGGSSAFLLENNQDNSFMVLAGEEIGLSIPFDLDLFRQAASFDYDNDGDQDLLVSFPGLYRNNSDGTFTDITIDTLIDAPQHGFNGAAVGDYNNDGHIDIFLTGMAGSVLYMNNNGDGTFTDVTEAAGNVGLGTTGAWCGTDFLDYDNDGDLDLHITEAFNGPGNVLYRNNGDGTFTNVRNVAFPHEVNPSWSDACMGDYNNDGAIDIYMPSSSYKGAGGFLKNFIGTKSNWIKIKLEGTISNRDAYGARVYIKTGELSQLREIHTGAVETQPIHFGLDNETLIDEIEVYWPSGIIQRLNNVSPNQLVTIVEPETSIPYISSISSSLTYVGDPITITGGNFGEEQGSGFVEFHNAIQAEITSWSDTEIICMVPMGAASGNIHVITNAGRSNGVYFTVLSVPTAPSGMEAIYAPLRYWVPDINLSWDDNSDNELGFQIERSLSPDSGFTQIAIVSGNITTYTDSTNLQLETIYYYRVRAYNDMGESEYSDVASSTTLTSPQPLTAASTAWPEIHLEWQDNSSSEEGVKVYRGNNIGEDWIEIAALDANTTTYTDADHGLTPDTDRGCTYRVQVYNLKGDSIYSNKVVIRPPPAAPSDLKTVAISTNEITLDWHDNSGIESGFKIERSLDGNEFSQIDTVAANVITYADQGLAPDTRYIYRVCAYDNVRYSGYSNIAETTTLSLNYPPTMVVLRTWFNTNFLWLGSDEEDGRNLRYSYRVGQSNWSDPTTARGIKISEVSEGLEPGTHILEVKAIDSQGAESDPKSLEFTI